MLLYGLLSHWLAPYGSICLQLGNVLWFPVRLVSRDGFLLSRGLAVLHWLPCLVERPLFQQFVSDLRRLAGKVKISTHRSSCYRFISSKGVVIEGISGFLEVLPEPIVGLFKVERVPIITTTLTSAESTEWVMLFKDAS